MSLSAAPDKPKMRLTAEAMDHLMEYGWSGNVRELKNVIVRAGNLAPNNVIEKSDLQLRGATFAPSPSEMTHPNLPVVAADAPFAIDLGTEFKDAKQAVVENFEIQYLEKLMVVHEGNISQASRAAGLTRYHLRELLKKYDLK